jgi:hypothetical protein
MQNVTHTYDANLLLKDAGLIAADAACQVGGADKILNVGSGRVDGTVVIDISAIETASSDEIYNVLLQGSNSATFASGIVPLGALEFGHATPLHGDVTTAVGRYELPFTNQQGGTCYKYIRLYVDVAGSIATGINFTAFVAKDGD